MSLEKLLERCAGNEAKAQKQLFDEYASYMLAVCMRYVKEREDAEELMLQGFQKFFEQAGSFSYQGDAAFVSYLKRVMVNECLMFLRKRKVTFDEIGSGFFMSAQEASPIDKLSSKEIFQLILQLPYGYGTVFNLFVIEGMSHREIADLLGITEGTSKSQLSKARALLQKMIRDNER